MVGGQAGPEKGWQVRRICGNWGNLEHWSRSLRVWVCQKGRLAGQARRPLGGTLAHFWHAWGIPCAVNHDVAVLDEGCIFVCCGTPDHLDTDTEAVGVVVFLGDSLAHGGAGLAVDGAVATIHGIVAEEVAADVWLALAVAGDHQGTHGDDAICEVATCPRSGAPGDRGSGKRGLVVGGRGLGTEAGQARVRDGQTVGGRVLEEAELASVRTRSVDDHKVLVVGVRRDKRLLKRGEWSTGEVAEVIVGGFGDGVVGEHRATIEPAAFESCESSCGCPCDNRHAEIGTGSTESALSRIGCGVGDSPVVEHDTVILRKVTGKQVVGRATGAGGRQQAFPSRVFAKTLEQVIVALEEVLQDALAVRATGDFDFLHLDAIGLNFGLADGGLGDHIRGCQGVDAGLVAGVQRVVGFLTAKHDGFDAVALEALHPLVEAAAGALVECGADERQVFGGDGFGDGVTVKTDSQSELTVFADFFSADQIGVALHTLAPEASLRREDDGVPAHLGSVEHFFDGPDRAKAAHEFGKRVVTLVVKGDA